MAKAAIMSVLHSAEDKYPNEVKDEILAAVGDIDHLEVFGEEILVAAYVQSPYFAGGRLLKGDKEQNEDKWQSKCFLILKLGNTVEKNALKHGLPVPKVGEWYWGNVQEHWQLSVRGIGHKARRDSQDATKFIRPWRDGGWPCRMVCLADIRGKNPRPQDIM